MKRATDNREENRNVIDKAIDKALEKKSNTQKEIEDILDNFLAKKVAPWIVDGVVFLKVYVDPSADDGTLVEANQGSERHAVLTIAKFSDKVKSNSEWIYYFRDAVFHLKQRTKRIYVEHVSTDDKPCYNFELSLKT